MSTRPLRIRVLSYGWRSAYCAGSHVLMHDNGRFSWRGVRLARRDEGAARRAVTEEAIRLRHGFGETWPEPGRE